MSRQNQEQEMLIYRVEGQGSHESVLLMAVVMLSVFV